MKLPINVTVIQPPPNNQRGVLTAAREISLSRDRVEFEESPDGLIIHGLTELDIEIAVDELRKRVPSIRYAKPQVAYDMGPPIQEPYYRATVDLPNESLGAVMGDLISRRGLIHSVRDGATSTQLVAELPVSECFGYSTTLRSLTQGKGHYSVEFAGYRPTPYIGPDMPDAA